MSSGMYQSAVLRLNRDKEAVQRQIAAEQDKIGKLRRDAAKIREVAAKTKSATVQSSKRRQAESKERELAAAERRLANLLGKKSKVEADLIRNLNALQRAAEQARRQHETDDKRRRQDELRHVHQVTRQIERQAQLWTSMPQGQLSIEVIQQLPKAITVLFLAANPRDTTWIGLDEEIRLIEQRLRASEHRDAVTLMEGLYAGNYNDFNINRTGLSSEAIEDTEIKTGGVDAAMKYLEQRPHGNSPAHLKVVGS